MCWPSILIAIVLSFNFSIGNLIAFGSQSLKLFGSLLSIRTTGASHMVLKALRITGTGGSALVLWIKSEYYLASLQLSSAFEATIELFYIKIFLLLLLKRS